MSNTPIFDYRDIQEIVERISGAPRKSKIVTPSPIIMKGATTAASLYGALIYVVGKGIIGQLLDYFEYKTASGEEYWHITYGITALYARLTENLIVPVAIGGFMAPDLLPIIKARKPTLLEFRHVLGEMPNVPKDTITNLEHIWSGEENGIILIDPYRLLGRSPREIERELVTVKSQLGRLQLLYSNLLKNYEREKSRRQTAESQLTQLKLMVDELRNKVLVLQEAVTSNEQELLEIYNRIHSLHRRISMEEMSKLQYENALDEMQGIMENTLKMLSMIKQSLGQLFEVQEEAGISPEQIAQQVQQQAGGEEEQEGGGE